MKIAVYAIAKNEEKHVERFLRSCAGADGVFILDTGSSDDTVAVARRLGAIVDQTVINPWRFDKARNESLKMVPYDYDLCICLDLDELMPANWRAAVEAAWAPGMTGLRYEFVWSHKPDGTPDLVYWAQKAHARHGYAWKHPVHEVLHYDGAGPENLGLCAMTVHHWPDASKSRSSYLPLLELSVREDPDNDRNAHYYGRELWFHGRLDEAEKELKRHLMLPKAVWKPERAASYRYLAKIAESRGDKLQAVAWLQQACREAPDTREPWIELAQLYYGSGDHEETYKAAKSCLLVGPERTKVYLTLDYAWGALPHDLLAVSAFYLGHYREAVEAGREAVRLAPADARLIRNLSFYEERV